MGGHTSFPYEYNVTIVITVYRILLLARVTLEQINHVVFMIAPGRIAIFLHKTHMSVFIFRTLILNFKLQYSPIIDCISVRQTKFVKSHRRVERPEYSLTNSLRSVSGSKTFSKGPGPHLIIRINNTLINRKTCTAVRWNSK